MSKVANKTNTNGKAAASNGKAPASNGKASASNGKASASNGHSTTDKKTDKVIDDFKVQHVSWSWAILSFLGVFFLPLCVYWCWISVEYYKGAMCLPKDLSVDSLVSWVRDDIFARIWRDAQPTWRATVVYLSWVAFQAVLFTVCPGPVGEGLPVNYGHDKGIKLKYKYNGQFAFFITVAVTVALHFTGVFPITELCDQFGPFLTVCSLYTAAIIAVLHFYAWCTGTMERPTDSILYNYFMGPLLNPRFFGFDVKFFHELRPGIMQWYFTTIAFAIKFYQTYDTLSTPMILICFYHLCFVNACYKGEQCVPASMDIIYEKFGYMLCWLDLVTVPFIFPLQAYYLYKVGPFEHPVWFTVLMACMHIFGYYLFDTANSQKDYFRAEHSKLPHIPYGFPRLPWDRLENPKFLQTQRGTKLLLSGWWGWARHMNYTGDLMMAWCWGMTCGFNSYFPYAYTTYLTPLLLHRERRDNLDCQTKYGKDWDAYCKKVPYRLIPYVY